MINKKERVIIFCSFCILHILITASCSHKLEPISNTDSLQQLNDSNINKFNGDYDIKSIDSSLTFLSYALTFYDKLSYKYQLKENDRLNLRVINNRHIKATLYINNKVRKSKIIKGHLSENYFYYKITRVEAYLILNVHKRQVNRIALLANGNITLDSFYAGILFLVIMPTFGGGGPEYNLVFKRK